MIYYNIYKNPLRCWTIFSPLNCGDGICEIAGATILGAGGRVLQCVAFCVTQEDGIRESQQRNGQLKKKSHGKAGVHFVHFVHFPHKGQMILVLGVVQFSRGFFSKMGIVHNYNCAPASRWDKATWRVTPLSK